MRRLAGIVALTMAALWAAGCTQAVRNADVADAMGATGVFTEAADGPAEPGKVDLILRISIKTHPQGFYLLESDKSLHGKPGYPFIVTIDGQTTVWRVDGQPEATPSYDAAGIRTPEGGEGRRYALEKRLRLTAGAHMIEIDLPEEPYAQSIRVVLEERGKPYLLELRPVYQRPGNRRPTFLHGISRLDPFMDSISRQ
jgi:hypothetical protein